MTEKNILGRNIETLRRLNNWSQARLAKEAAPLVFEDQTLSQKTISNIESGRHAPTIEKLVPIAQVFGLEVWQLFLPLPELFNELYFQELEDLVECFRLASTEGRRTILRVAQHEAKATPEDPPRRGRLSIRGRG